MRPDIEQALANQDGRSKTLLKIPGRLKKALKSAEGVVGSAEVVDLLVVAELPASVRDKMSGTTGEHLSRMRQENEQFLLVLTASDLVEIRGGGAFSGGPEVTRIPLRTISSTDFDSPRMARTLGAKLNLLSVESQNTGSAVWKPMSRGQGESFARAVERQRAASQGQ
jgi:hypothetical protein